VTTQSHHTATSAYQQLRGHLHYLRLEAAAEALPAALDHAQAHQLGHTAFLEHLLAIEVQATEARRHASRMRFAAFPAPWRLEDFDFDAQPGIDRALVGELATLRFIDEHANVLLIGPPGVGKTHLALALGHLAVDAGYRVSYVTAADLVARCHRAALEGRWATTMRTLAGHRLLIIDELGCAPRGAALPGGVRDPTTGHRNGRMKLRTADPRRCGERREQS
jgi:DNA replication protein DnaC